MPRDLTATPARQDLVSTDPSDPELSAAIGTLGSEFVAVVGRVTSLRRVWLDTFDERLRRAGLVLEQAARDGEIYLELTDADGRSSLRAQAPGVTWPAFAADLPAGPLRDRVAPVTDIRALLDIGGFRSRQREIRVLNSDQKVVARLVVDVPAGAADAAAPVVLSVDPVRGYGAAADRIVTLLARAPGVAYSDQSRRGFAAAAAAAPEERGAAAADSALTADTPAPEAVAMVLHAFRRTLEANVPGLLADIDTEFLHDFRVAVRRARSTVKLTGDALGDDRAVALGAELKWLGDLTSPTRDLDVYILGLPAMTRAVGSLRAGDLEPFELHLRRRRAVEQRRLVRGVRSKRFRALLGQWRGIDAGPRAAGSPETLSAGSQSTAADLAARAVGQAHRRVMKLGSAIDSASPAEDLHTLRKRCKELRYLLEIFAPIHDTAAHKRVLQVLKALQECLGDFQDSEVQADSLRTFGTEMASDGTASPATLLAMGELAAALHAEQQRARATFDATFAGFASPKIRRSVDRLRPAAGSRRADGVPNHPPPAGAGGTP